VSRAIDDILEFWFGELDAAGLCVTDRSALWFGSSEETDKTCRERFGALLQQALRGQLDHWAEDDRGLVALVVLIDQFSRNVHRGTPRAFAGDPRALALACAAIDAGRHRQLPAIHRVFLYLPLEHSEDLAMQARCVALFEELVEDSGRTEVESFLRYAVAHRDVIARFGRFPHRNAILGRPSTDTEQDYLANNGGF